MIKLRLDKRAVRVTSLKDKDEKAYWKSKSPAQRMRAIEINRRIVYGYGETPPRFQRFLEIVKLKES